jgi:phenylacetate-CoA ligase
MPDKYPHFKILDSINKIIFFLADKRYATAFFKLKKQGHQTLVIDKKLKSLLSVCKNQIPYFKSLKLNNYDSLNVYPFLDKRIIKEKFSQLQNEKLKRSRFKKDSTSGSTGEKTKYFTDKEMLYYRHACADYGDTFSGWNFGESRLIIWGAERDIKESLIKKLINSPLLFNTKIVSSYHMTADDMDNYIDIINRFRPMLIVGYPSTLDFFSSHIEKSKKLTHFPKAIITSGETLYQNQRANIQRVFSCKVMNRYGCREVGGIAHECIEQNGLHIHSSHVIVEVVDANGNACKPGELGEIVVTDLDNYAFPFVRYKIGDLGILSDRKCKCGINTPMLQSVEGRTFDLIIGTNGNRVPGNFFTLLRNKIKGINQFQIIQKKQGEITAKLIVTDEFNDNEKSSLFNELRKKLGADMAINFEFVNSIDTTQTGKFRFVISEINPFVAK